MVIAALLTIAAPPTAIAAEAPAAVMNLQARSPVWDFSPRIELDWDLPAGVDDALVCWNVGATPPAAPAMATCGRGDPVDEADFAMDGDFRVQYAFSVFSHLTSTGAYGPPVSVLVTADRYPPDADAFEDVSDSPVSSTSVRICWGGDHAGAVDAWAVFRAPGIRPPPVIGPPEASWRGDPRCYLAEGLRPGRAYTFTILGSNPAGEVAASHTVVARRPGAYVITPPSGRSALPGSSQIGSEVTVTSSHGGAQIHAVYLKRIGATRRLAYYYTWRTRSGRWSPPVLLTRDRPLERVLMSANDAGEVVVGWTRPSGQSAAVYRYRSEDGRWSPVQRPKAIRFLRAIAIDRDGHVHLLARRDRFNPDFRLIDQYLTNASGRWRSTTVRDARLMAYDATTNRVVMVVGNAAGGFAVADKPAATLRFGRRHAPPGAAVAEPAGVTAAAGQITVTCTADPGGVYLATGRGPAAIGGLAHVPGTTGNDTLGPVAVATGRDRLLVGWTRNTVAWDWAAGIWLAVRDRNPRTGRWRYASIRQVTGLPYDSLGAIAAGPAGDAILGFGRN